MNFNCELLIFDLDGTLIESRKDIANAVNKALALCGIRELADEKIYTYIGNGAKYLIEKSIGKANIKLFDIVMQNFNSYYADHLTDHSFLHPEVKDVLEHFKNKKIILLSNKPEKFCRHILEDFGVYDYFEDICGGDTFEKLKPNPAGVKQLLKKYQIVQEHCILVGDSPQDINAAREAGIKAVAVTYGYHSENRLKKENPDLIIDTLAALKNYLN